MTVEVVVWPPHELTYTQEKETWRRLLVSSLHDQVWGI